jgi:LPPG:FO 2-phospho-L-lactate transferase
VPKVATVAEEAAVAEEVGAASAGRTVTALAGGVGAAKMLAGLAAVIGQRALTAVVNTGDDTVLHGLHVSPDLDTVTYTLASAHNPATGWGLANETWCVMEALAAFEKAAVDGAELTWFALGDKDLATHLYRTGRLQSGVPLSQVTAEVCRRFGVEARLLPMSDDPVETRVAIRGEDLADAPAFGGLARLLRPHQTGLAEASPKGAGLAEVGVHGAALPEARPKGARVAEVGLHGAGLAEVGFQEYFVGLRHSVPVRSVRFAGAESASPGPGVLHAIERADAIVICPSNPVVSIGPIMAVPGIAEAVQRRRENTVAVSPIVAGKALKGPADRMLAELGEEPSAAGVARLWAPYAATIVIDEADEGLAPRVEAAGMRAVVAPTVMSGPEEAARLARTVLENVPTVTS